MTVKSNIDIDLTDDLQRLVNQLERFKKQFPAEYKIKFYIDQAMKQLEGENDDDTQKGLHKLLGEGRFALQALKDRNMDGLLEAYEGIHRWRAILNLPFYKSLGVSEKQSEIAKRGRRPGLPKRAVMEAMGRGCANAEQVRNFLFNSSDLTDNFGDIGIDQNENDDFEITDYSHKDQAGECKTATLKSSRIPKLISDLK